jgi:beta-phosphoglucomutase-like phosphatase (HAD superfamily)
MTDLRSVIFDVDGVLLDWHAGFGAFMEAQGRPPSCHRRYRASYHLAPIFGLKDRDEEVAHMNAYHDSHHFHHIPRMPGAFEAVGRLRRRVHAHIPFHAVTAIDDVPHLRRAREAQLAGLPLDSLTLVGLNGSKTPHFQALGPALVFEDSVTKAAEAMAAGCTVVIVDWGYNRDAPCHGRIHSWDEVDTVVERFLGRP